MGPGWGSFRKKRLRALEGVEDEDNDPDYIPPKTIFEALYRLDPEEIFFHLSTGVHSGCPDPWEYSLHDYFLLSGFWQKMPPPHVVAGVFVTKQNSDGSQDEKSGASRRRRSRANARGRSLDKERAYNETLATMGTDPIMGGRAVMRGRADSKQRKRVDTMMQIVQQLNDGASLDTLKAPWEK